MPLVHLGHLIANLIHVVEVILRLQVQIRMEEELSENILASVFELLLAEVSNLDHRVPTHT